MMVKPVPSPNPMSSCSGEINHAELFLFSFSTSTQASESI